MDKKTVIYRIQQDNNSILTADQALIFGRLPTSGIEMVFIWDIKPLG